MPENPQSLVVLLLISCWLCSIIGLWSLDGKLAPPVEKSEKASKCFKTSISCYSKPCIKDESRRTPQSKLMFFVSLQYRNAVIAKFMTHGKAQPKDTETVKATERRAISFDRIAIGSEVSHYAIWFGFQPLGQHPQKRPFLVTRALTLSRSSIQTSMLIETSQFSASTPFSGPADRSCLTASE